MLLLKLLNYLIYLIKVQKNKFVSENYYNIDFKTSKNDEPFCYKHVKNVKLDVLGILKKFMLIEN